MIVTCPDCKTQFEIPDAAYRPGRKARCSSCGGVFTLPAAQEDVSPAGAEAPGKSASAGAAGAVEPAGEAGAAPAGEGAPEAAEPPEPPVPAEAAADGGTFFENVVLDQDRRAKSRGLRPKVKSGRGKVVVIILGVALMLALLGYGGHKVYTAFIAPPAANDPVRLSDGRLSRSLGGRTDGADQEKEAAREKATRRIGLQNVRQYMVKENKDAGPFVVIEGSAVNNFDAPKSLILLELTLYDKKGNALVLQEQYCGITLPDLQLRTLGKAALQSALNNQTNILINNTDIPSGGSVPFMALFFNLPEEMYEFEVKIADVQDSAR
ncbi:MAG: zinc-ribbon domain-containing protein [Deltaproteobacteria bacterium]|jgi:predicted Zn finger-like uncharacterized protein|nr:zinc-ribbon domain-containing protein [Deltaproteobacteria bacterium]